MELTKLTHKLTIGGVAHVIDEPIGFDGLKVKISRGNYHGVSAEVSVSKLEFYDNAGRNAASIIRDAYNTDVDTEIMYTVTDESGEVLYSGAVDLSTYSETNANATKVSVNVGEVGIKTTFNNRTDTEVDLNRTTTIDGASLAHNPTWLNKLVPARSIVYKNQMEQPTTKEYTQNVAGETLAIPDESPRILLGFTLEKTKSKEFGTFEPQWYCAKMSDLVYDGYIEPLFSKGEDFDKKYGAGSTYDMEVNVRFRVKFDGDIVTSRTNTPYFQFSAALKNTDVWSAALISGTQRYVSNDGGDYGRTGGEYGTQRTENCHNWLTYEIRGTVRDCTESKLFIFLYGYNCNNGYNNPTSFRVEMQAGSYIRMTLKSKVNTTVYSDMLFVHEALNKIVECISENQLTCKSNLYGRIDSIVNPYPTGYAPQATAPFGAGAMKALTNGYKIRGLYSTGETERNMPLSFKNIIEALDAMDCIGWGIVEEDGQLFVRVENWEWFYKSNIVCTINEPNEKTRTATQDNVITQLTIGYKKYTTNEDYSTNENYHSERVFTSKLKALSKEVSKLCSLIADTYSIEVTRRAKDEIDETQEFKYDENIFVFEFEGDAYYGDTPNITYRVATDSIANAYNVTNIKELFNARISPRRMAERWKQRIAIFNTQSPHVITKGTVNYKAQIKCKNTQDLGGHRLYYLSNGAVAGTLLSEDAQIAHQTPLIKAETLKVKFPISLNQYKAIKANPYGLIVVDGEKCWLKEMQYEFKTGMAEFTLIPKYEQ